MATCRDHELDGNIPSRNQLITPHIASLSGRNWFLSGATGHASLAPSRFKPDLVGYT